MQTINLSKDYSSSKTRSRQLVNAHDGTDISGAAKGLTPAGNPFRRRIRPHDLVACNLVALSNDWIKAIV